MKQNHEVIKTRMKEKSVHSTIIYYMGHLIAIYPVYIASGEVLAIDAKDNQSIITIFKNKDEFYLAEQVRYI